MARENPERFVPIGSINPGRLREKIRAAAFVATCTGFNERYLKGLGVAPEFPIEQMPHIERNILRIALFAHVLAPASMGVVVVAAAPMVSVPKSSGRL